MALEDYFKSGAAMELMDFIHWVMNTALATFDLVAQVWPIASWNDAITEAWRSLQLLDCNQTCVIAAMHQLMARPCTIRVAGITGVTRRRLCVLASSPILGVLAR